jgi:hypothetical protein
MVRPRFVPAGPAAIALVAAARAIVRAAAIALVAAALAIVLAAAVVVKKLQLVRLGADKKLQPVRAVAHVRAAAATMPSPAAAVAVAPQRMRPAAIRA